MKLNEEKCHLLAFDQKDTEISINIGTSVINENEQEKLLGVLIDQKLKFKQHLNKIFGRQARGYMLLQRPQLTYLKKN